MNMNKQKVKQLKKARRRQRIRVKISGTKSCPRLNVFRSNKGIYAQLIDDQTGKTLASVHSQELQAKGHKTELSLELGKLLAKKAGEKKISQVVFDRGGYKYHGRVKALAEGARAGGLKF
ncbi:50S ribosomal protein L18 [Candidatus Falkowbacteria bacterium CG_4_9_14_3_um_filter_38_19]|uniref:Large ribosomal subunit protein uL18 n=2 Tax=Candidatus Falkowiibacteriota TaxID=1752728 RepID=A0A2M6WR58_9BACT|nr:50S ribosomal protein L18 [Candidatus Falkowbacteria bacterium]PIT95297.1 MAG: 50S ribosomal protein L18 [Candidatus Falkowbacteria bacterium CG10_big_fil_rev_8_21_14_0_10_38_22]PJB16029.1 MAG: 50S ribosomal protein L18 [Candidatus Falkowbacteria bacterium CG_4_9_14_3_um_filter_38_19]